MTKIGIKAKYGKQCRRFRITQDLTLIKFYQQLEKLFSTDLDNVTLKYKDEDGDWVNIDTEEEFAEAKFLTSETKTKILRIVIFKKRKENKNKNDMEKYVVDAITESGRVLDTKKATELYSNVAKGLKEKEAQELLSKFIKEIGTLFSELSVQTRPSEISQQLRKEFNVDVNIKNGNISVGKPKRIERKKRLGAQFVEDVTIQSDTEVEQESKFVKIWKVKNNGDMDWTSGCYLTFVGGSDELNIQKDTKFKLSKLAKKGESVEVKVELVAPKNPGTYSAFFKLNSPAGKEFGPKLLLELLVVENKALKKWEEKLIFLREMGFFDAKKLIPLLEKNNGDLPATIQDHLSSAD